MRSRGYAKRVQPVPRISPLKTLWQGLFHFQTGKLNAWMALRNTAGVALPLIAGAALGSVTDGLIVSTGALNVAFRDSDAPYRQRAKHLFAASILAGISVFTGAFAGNNHVAFVFIAGAWAFAAGMLVAIGQSASDLGLMSVVMVVVYGANPMQPHNAALSGVGAFAGGLLQMVLSLLFWPIRRYAPERRALSEFYQALANAAATPQDHAAQPPPASTSSLEAQTSLAALDRDSSAEGRRYRFLLSQAERIRLSLIALSRLRIRLLREASGAAALPLLDRFFEIASRALASIAASMQTGEPAASPADLSQLENVAEQMREPAVNPAAAAMTDDARFQMDALLGQIRSAVDLSALADVAAAPPRHWRHRAYGTFATLRANLNFDSTAFRHALRLAFSVMAGEAIGRGLGFTRPYWIPMTVAIVLKPDFSSTFSRGVLRLAGTFLGLIVATALFHVLPATVWAQIAAIAGLMFAVRYYGAAHYGILAGAVGALVVFLISLTGVAPKEAIAARALDTAIGGALALAVYGFWPTWERTQVAPAIATMLDTFRAYFHALRESYHHPEREISLDRERIAGRRARTNMEASIERASSEPGVSASDLAVLTGILASSQRLAQALIALEAAIASNASVPPRAAFHRFADDLERTLEGLSKRLRGASVDPAALPDLREDHHALVHSAESGVALYALVNVETDRITNSVNTLSADVFRWTRYP